MITHFGDLISRFDDIISRGNELLNKISMSLPEYEIISIITDLNWKICEMRKAPGSQGTVLHIPKTILFLYVLMSYISMR